MKTCPHGYPKYTCTFCERDRFKAERNRLLSEADYTHTERDTVMGYLKDKEAEIAALQAERDQLRAQLEHWDVTLWAETKAENVKLRAFVEELTNREHHNPPVPLWIELKARALLELIESDGSTDGH